MTVTFYRKRWFWVVCVLVLLGGGWYWYGRVANQGPFYETQAVTRGRVGQTVEVTGSIAPDARIDLAFKGSGLLKEVLIKKGDVVLQGQLLASLDKSDVNLTVRRAEASLALARANLAAKQAGETKESIQIAQASVDQAAASLAKAQDDLAALRVSVEDDFRVAQIAMDTAARNYTNAQATNNQSVTSSYENLHTTLQTAVGYMQTGLSDGNRLIGLTSDENVRYRNLLGVNNSAALSASHSHYDIAMAAYTPAYASVRALSSSLVLNDVRASAILVQDALQKTQQYLDDAQTVLAGTITGPNLTATELATKKTTIDADRGSVSVQLAAVTTGLQTINSSEFSRTTTLDQLRNALDTATTNAQIADHNRTTKVQAAETAVTIQAAALASTRASLAAKKAPVRAVDLAALRAQVLDAQAAVAQAQARVGDVQIVAPSDGTITDVIPEVGEQIAPNVAVISMINKNAYTFEALVPESDISKTSVGQHAVVTLDAYGEDVKFNGSVVSEDPDQTKVQDAIYYKVSISIDKQDGYDVKPGMTANITIQTAERPDALIAPSRAIRDTNGQKSVRVLQNNVAKEVNVTVGLRGDSGQTEILSGLAVGDQVILGELTTAEYKTWLGTQGK